MTRNLAKYLYACQHADGKERQMLARGIDPKMSHTDIDGKIWKVRELLLTNQLETSGLVQAEVMDTLMGGAALETCVRDVLKNAISTAKGDTFTKAIYGARTSYWPEVAQAASIKILNQDYQVASGSIKKYAVRPMISNEMVNDGKFDDIANEILWAGACGENTLNRLTITELLDSANNEMDTAGTSGWQGIKAVSSAIALGKVDGFRYNRLILCPNAEAMIGREFLPVGSYWPTAASANWASEGTTLGKILGLTTGVWSGGDASSTYNWDYAANADIGMLLLQENAACAIAMREDIYAEEFKDPIHDLTGLKCAMRVGVDSPASNDGICRVEF